MPTHASSSSPSPSPAIGPSHRPAPDHPASPRVALVTGGGSGIGRAAALAFARTGANVVVAGRRPAELAETVARIVAEGGRAAARPTDVAVGHEVAALVAFTLDRFGRLDAAFNNAGTEGRFAPLAELTEADFDGVVAVNLRGAWLSIQHEVAAMRATGHGGSIVNTSSFLATSAAPGACAYAASKAALDGLVRQVAAEVGPDGIRINNVSAGAIRTPMFARLDGEAAAAAVAGHTPLRRLGTPEDVADAAVWLCSDAARFVTGQTLAVDGGLAIPGMR